jgi:hypothetical protein
MIFILDYFLEFYLCKVFKTLSALYVVCRDEYIFVTCITISNMYHVQTMCSVFKADSSSLTVYKYLMSDPEGFDMQ